MVLRILTRFSACSAIVKFIDIVNAVFGGKERGRVKLRVLNVLYLVLGAGLLAFVVSESNIDEILSKFSDIGAIGVALVLFIYLLGFVIDTASWQLTIERLGGRFNRLYMLWKIRMVGEAFNVATPLGTMGGEPVKAALLKNALNIPYNQGIASLVMAKTINLIALIYYLGIGLGFILLSSQFSLTFKYSASIGLGALAAGVGGFFLVQRFRGFSRIGTVLTARGFTRSLRKWVDGMKAFEDELVSFYKNTDDRFSHAIALAFLNWVVGTVEIYAIANLLGTPVSIEEAWILESAVQLTRAATFFIPLSLGTQEGALFMVTAAITGDGAFGIAISLVKRFREIIWVAWGFAIGWRLPFTASPPSDG